MQPGSAGPGSGAPGSRVTGSAEIYTYESASPLYAMNWSVSAAGRAPSTPHGPTPLKYLALSLAVCDSAQVRKDKRFRLGLGSFREESSNYVEIVTRERGAWAWRMHGAWDAKGSAPHHAWRSPPHPSPTPSPTPHPTRLVCSG
jgi:hypothetical protein